ncbi:hypothetical protein N431DRAFT_428874 [Stipitochalara longipes BDJ]|nr:hypothetical protein N431DRAFT_428874 [Stipitochalara longipes BDJ]
MATTDSDPVLINFCTPENASFYAAKLYNALNHHTGDFRLLEILPGQEPDRIKCNIIQPPETYSLKYECISYRAGDPKKVLEIEVNGHSFNTFASLGAALRKIRQPDRSRVVWADQICINQNDVEERGSQVSKIRGFYEKAECVIAWLGPLEGGDLAFRTVQSLRREVDTQMARRIIDGMSTETTDILSGIAKSVMAEILSDAPEILAKYEAVGNIFRSEFWGRLWIWQELIVAKRAHLEWEMYSTQLDDLEIIFGILQHLLVVEWPPHKIKSRDFLMGNIPNGSASKVFEIMKLRTRRRVWQEQKILPLDRLLDTARSAYCTDPRDKVFALCGFSAPQLGIVPDYKASTCQVYISTAAAIMAEGCSLDILAYCKHSGIAESVDLPTWCPDWSSVSHAERVPLLAGDFLANCAFETSQGKTAVFRVVPERPHNEVWLHTSLFAVGLSIGTVQHIGGLATGDRKTNEEKFRDLLSTWAKLAVFGGISDEGIFQELEKTAILENRGFYKLASQRNDEDTFTGDIDKTNYRALQLDAVHGHRRFFITSNGLMGMAPPHVEEGDAACVLLGAQVPFLLRKDKDSGFYTLIGEVYISNGYMYGRAIDEMEAGKIQTQEFEIR